MCLLRFETNRIERLEEATLVVSRGDDVADVLLCVGGLPFLSRTIRLAADVPQFEINRYLQAETQRTLISAGGQMAQPPRIAHVVIVGNEQQTEGLDDTLSEHFQVAAAGRAADVDAGRSERPIRSSTS